MSKAAQVVEGLKKTAEFVSEDIARPIADSTERKATWDQMVKYVDYRLKQKGFSGFDDPRIDQVWVEYIGRGMKGGKVDMAKLRKIMTKVMSRDKKMMGRAASMEGEGIADWAVDFETKRAKRIMRPRLAILGMTWEELQDLFGDQSGRGKRRMRGGQAQQIGRVGGPQPYNIIRYGSDALAPNDLSNGMQIFNRRFNNWFIGDATEPLQPLDRDSGTSQAGAGRLVAGSVWAGPADRFLLKPTIERPSPSILRYI